MPHPYLDGPYPRAYAHRGWHLGELTGCENTVAAFVAAADHGLGYVEMDVHTSADGVPFVHHDPTLDRTTDATGAIADRTAAELDTVLVTGTARNEPLPRLADALAAIPGIRVTIELKSDSAVLPTLGVLDEGGDFDRVCLGSFSGRRLQRARDAAGEKLCTSMGALAITALRARAWGVPSALLPAPSGVFAQVPPTHGPIPVAADPRFVAAAHGLGREVHVWTVDAVADMHRLLDDGVDGLLSDRPDLLLEVVSARPGTPWAR
ncbi:glycerophosphodiester phosphodiesterase family protein [Pseudonocardia phyllosphaerae]|uniref:glycerophosphodiester phosphodiesterase family protein n=1 Tax=Pseudonocardia phyllosphaerae TaxID=3390502 RepID=UPI00397D726D